MAEAGIGQLRFPFDVAGRLLECDHAGVFLLAHRAEEDEGVFVEDWAACKGDVEGVGDDLLAPDDVAVKIDGGEDGRCKGAEYEFSVGGRGGGGVTSAGPAAKIGAEPGAGRDELVPEEFSVGGVVAGQVMLGDDRFAVGDFRGPVDGADEDGVVPDDQAGVALAF